MTLTRARFRLPSRDRVHNILALAVALTGICAAVLLIFVLAQIFMWH